MILLPDDIVARLPPLYSQEELGEQAIVHVKFFTPWAGWTWYCTEYDPEDRMCFGLIDGLEQELGYWSMDELEEIVGPGGLKIERDIHWTPKPLAECRRA